MIKIQKGEKFLLKGNNNKLYDCEIKNIRMSINPFTLLDEKIIYFEIDNVIGHVSEDLFYQILNDHLIMSVSHFET